jgi:hypothetical protein
MNMSIPMPVRDQSGQDLLLVGGYTGAFFLSPAIHEHVAALQRSLEDYLLVVPHDTLKWQAIGAGAEDWRPIGAKTLAQCRDQLCIEAARRRDLTSIELRSGGNVNDASTWSVTIIGNPVDTEMPDENTLFEFTLPAATFDSHEAESAARLFMRMAQQVPYRHAYFSPALLWSPVLEDEALGGVGALERASGGTFDAVPFKEGVALRAGSTPALKASSGPSFQAMCRLATVLEPITSYDEAALTATEFAPDDDESFVPRWERRFLGTVS